MNCVSAEQFQLNKEPTPENFAQTHENFQNQIESGQKEDVFIWLNYCMFLTLTGKSTEKIFERALLYTFGRPNRKLLFLEYLRWQISQKYSRPQVLDTLDRIFNRFGPDVDSPLRDEIPDELLRYKSVYNHFVSPSAEDYSYLDQVVQCVVDYFPDFESKDLVLNLYLQRFPRNFMIHNKLAELALSQKNLNKARKGFTSAIKLCPCFAPAWERLIDLELEHNPSEVRSLLLSALTHLPESQALQAKQTKLNELTKRKDI